ncbi:MAG: Abi family protein [Bacteroidales bacterium]
MNYSKYYTSPKDLVSLLKARGLHIENDIKAENYLQNIGYFRLSAYCYPLLQQPKSSHQYKNGASFNQILNLYRFDRKLRLLIFNEIEKIEVAIRSIVINTACAHFGDIFWMTDPSRFINNTHFTKFISDLQSDIRNSSEDFIIHFREKYSNPFPPAWTIAEILSLGGICHVYKNIKDNSLKKKIAKKFGLQPIVFESWILTLAGLRNICCHHGRLWNRTLKLKPVIPHKTTHKWISNVAYIDIQRVYFRLCIIKYLLISVSPHNSFKEKLIEILDKYPTVDIAAMGFPDNWTDEFLWT